MRIPLGLSLALAALALVDASPRAAAQIPDEFRNLQVLPKDITRAEIVITMREWASDLGVRCNHCHVGPENLQGMDFATDERDTKKAAREMLRMVQTINGGTLRSLPPRAEPRRQVTCMTCHRGAQRPPLPLAEELVQAARAKGAAGASERYAELRRDHSTDGQYDFRWISIGMATRLLFEEGRLDDALGVVRFGLEQHPESGQLHWMLGEALARKDERGPAIEALRKALALDPQNEAARRSLAKLEAPPPEPTPTPTPE